MKQIFNIGDKVLYSKIPRIKDFVVIDVKKNKDGSIVYILHSNLEKLQISSATKYLMKGD